MEKRKVDFNFIIGISLIFLIFIWYSRDRYINLNDDQDDSQPILEEKSVSNSDLKKDSSSISQSSQAIDFKKAKYIKDSTINLENDVIKLGISTKGGQINLVMLKDYKTYKKEDLYLVNNNNSKFNLEINVGNKTINTSEIYFYPQIIENNKVIMRGYVSDEAFIEYEYNLREKEYMLDYKISSNTIITRQGELKLDWQLNGYRHEKSMKNESLYTELQFFSDNSRDYLSYSGTKEDEAENVDWIAYKQQYFSSILISDKSFYKTKMISESLDEDTLLVKRFASYVDLKTSGNIDYDFKWYFGPNDYYKLKGYDIGLEYIIDLGWGIFGWINKYFLIYMFSLLEKLNINYGLVILLLTLIVKTILFPVTYKNYISSAKLRVIRPEVNQLNEKYKNADNVKKQQAMMELYRKTGVNPLSGCIPSLIQLPIIIALYRLFPCMVELRQKSFLWADDLSSYDSIYDFPQGFTIPFYGDHISLFTLLMAASIIVYNRMSGIASQPTQPGMPNMKIIMYIIPIMMIFWFNDFSSGLTYYYFMANAINIAQMYIIKKYIIDENKIRAKIQENKKKPVKLSRWQKKMDEIYKQNKSKRK